MYVCVNKVYFGSKRAGMQRNQLFSCPCEVLWVDSEGPLLGCGELQQYKYKIVYNCEEKKMKKYFFSVTNRNVLIVTSTHLE